MTEKKLCSSCGQEEPCGCVISTLNSVVNEVIDLTFEIKAQWKRTYEFHESIGKRMLTLEGEYKADSKFAKETIKNIHEWENTLTQGCSTLVKRLDKLENNIKISSYVEMGNLLDRIKIIEDFIGQNYNADMGNIRERVLEVQGVCIHNNGVLCEDISNIELAVNSMEQEISCIFTSLKGIETQLMGKPFQLKPHKCPVCDSEGYVKGIENNIAWGHRCYTCEGKGIVWG